jgi:EmrB/QacA subfamily drug resistance transporter
MTVAPPPTARRLTLLAVSVALFMVLIDNTVVNVAIPSIQRALNASLTTLEWTVNAYTLGIAVFLVAGGRLGDLLGRRRVFVTGIVLFALASVAVAAAPTSAAIVAARGAQGIAAALLMPGTLSILSDAFPPEERGRAIGIWSGVAGIALVIGPLLGGAIVEAVSWRAIFLINVPISILAVALTLVGVRESHGERGAARSSIDIPGIATLSAALATVTLALIEGNDWGWGSAAVVGLFAASAVASIAFVAVERRVSAPILDPAWLRSRPISGPTVASTGIAFVMFGMLFFLTIYLQRALGYSPLEAGAAFLPMTVLVAIAAPLAGRLSDRFGMRLPAVTGLLLAAASMLVASRVSNTSGYGLIVPAFALMGVAIGFAITPTSTAVMNAVEPERAGVAAGFVSMTRMVGGTLGVAVLGAVFQSALPPAARSGPLDPAHLAAIGRGALVDGLAGAMLAGAAVAIASAVAAWVLMRPQREPLGGLSRSPRLINE